MKNWNNCKHEVFTETWNGPTDRRCVYVSNDLDEYYVQEFSDSRELLNFVGELLKAHDEVFATDGRVTRLLHLQVSQPEARVFLEFDEEEIGAGLLDET